MDLVRGEPSHVVSIDLQDLVTKPTKNMHGVINNIINGLSVWVEVLYGAILSVPWV